MEQKQGDKNNLFRLLQELKDYRRKQGLMYPLPIVLLIAIMGIMSGAKSERSISRFAENNKKDLIKYLQLKRKKIPTRNIIDHLFLTLSI